MYPRLSRFLGVSVRARTTRCFFFRIRSKSRQGRPWQAVKPCSEGILCGKQVSVACLHIILYIGTCYVWQPDKRPQGMPTISTAKQATQPTVVESLPLVAVAIYGSATYLCATYSSCSSRLVVVVVIRDCHHSQTEFMLGLS